jgi:uncharacterized DUF497 family protein
MVAWTECEGFDWNEGNSGKNWDKHGVADFECEEIFFNQPLVVRYDSEQSQSERRFHALGQTDKGRFLFVAFTIRRNLIRVISARDMTRREQRFYISYEKNRKDS